MSTINTNVSSLIAQQALARNNSALSTSLERLSTGLRINSGADDPAGLIAAQDLTAQSAGITQAISNANRASNIVGTAEGGLSEVSNLLIQLQSLVSESANTGGLSADEQSANQLQVNSILDTVNRIAQGTTFEGTALLNGNYSYSTSGVTSTDLQDVQINSALVPDNGHINVVVQVTASAQTGKITNAGSAVGTSGVTLQIAGNAGTEQLSFGSGTTASAIAAAVNGDKGATGVSALISGGTLVFNSTQFGSAQFASVQAISGTYTLTGGTNGKAFGKDATVAINGSEASAQGTQISYSANGLDVQLNLAAAFNTPGTTSFAITGGGATFALGPVVNEANDASLGIDSVSTGSLGNATIGYLSSLASGQTNSLTSGNLTTAQNIVTEAINQVSSLRGRLGAFQDYTVGSTVNSLGVAFTNAQSALSAIQDTDFAAETANLTRDQILSQAATTVLSTANSTPDEALTLLQGH
jgi:flagellin